MAKPTPDAVVVAQRLAHAAESGIGADELASLMTDVDALFAAHQDLVYAACLRFVGNAEKAMELAQDTLLTAYQKLPGFRGDARFRTWLLKIARYRCMNAMRKHGELLAQDGVIEPTDPASSVLTALRRREREELIRKAAAAVLDAVEQEVVHLRYTEHLPLDRITELLRLTTASGARGVLQRSKRKLQHEVRRRLAEMGHGTSFIRGTLE
ncbi:MAG: sigma-70 family RNA polymerase sigma factor [Deltaproteobacteria bacterium]|nr:sigma-70 family RNA polymerase sigma factor [Deltaproteobacteria bacterium]